MNRCGQNEAKGDDQDGSRHDQIAAPPACRRGVGPVHHFDQRQQFLRRHLRQNLTDGQIGIVGRHILTLGAQVLGNAAKGVGEKICRRFGQFAIRCQRLQGFSQQGQLALRVRITAELFGNTKLFGRVVQLEQMRK